MSLISIDLFVLFIEGKATQATPFPAKKVSFFRQNLQKYSACPEKPFFIKKN